MDFSSELIDFAVNIGGAGMKSVVRCPETNSEFIDEWLTDKAPAAKLLSTASEIATPILSGLKILFSVSS